MLKTNTYKTHAEPSKQLSKHFIVLNGCKKTVSLYNCRIAFLRVIKGTSQYLFHLPKLSLCEKCPNTEFFLVLIFPYSVRIRENKDQKKLRIWTFFTQCINNQQK